MQFHVSETCPRCRKPVRLATIEPHPTRTDIALHSFECAECGYVERKMCHSERISRPGRQIRSVP